MGSENDAGSGGQAPAGGSGGESGSVGVGGSHAGETDPSGAIRLSFAPFEAASTVTTHTQRVEAIDVLEVADSDDHWLAVVDASGNAWRFRNATGWQL